MIILASASPRRRELLTRMGLEFSVITSDTSEFTKETEPGAMVEALSRMKAEDVLTKVPEGFGSDQERSDLIIAADTLVFADGKALGKPQSEKEAYEMLELLQGRSHEVRTGVTLIMKKKESTEVRSFHEETRVIFSPMTSTEIQDYIASGEPMDKAGAYGIQGLSARFIEGIDGDYFNVVGLPVSRLYRELKAIGYIKA